VTAIMPPWESSVSFSLSKYLQGLKGWKVWWLQTALQQRPGCFVVQFVVVYEKDAVRHRRRYPTLALHPREVLYHAVYKQVCNLWFKSAEQAGWSREKHSLFVQSPQGTRYYPDIEWRGL
jgi:hypothetical protein